MQTLAVEVSAIFAEILQDRRRGELVASRLGLFGKRPSIAEIGEALGRSRQRAKQIVDAARDQFLNRRPVLRSLDAIEWGVFEDSVRALSVADIVAEHGLASAGNDKWGLIWLARSYGYSRLADELARHQAVAFEKQFLVELRKTVRKRGAVTLENLAAELDSAGWEVTHEQLALACEAVSEIKWMNGIAVSRSDDVLVANALRKAFSVSPRAHLITLLNAVVRVQQSRSMAAVISLVELEEFLQAGPSIADDLGDGWYLSRNDEPADQVLEGIELEILNLIEASREGLTSRRELVDALVGLGYSVHSATQYMSYSAIVDFACSGVFRLRGRPFDAGEAERIRNSHSSRASWTPWGWAGVDAIWLMTSANGGKVRLRLPAEIANLMADNCFQCAFADGTIIGEIEVGPDLRFELPDFIGTGKIALEVKLFPELRIAFIPLGESDDSTNAYPGRVDSCVLRNGGWRFGVEVDESILNGDHVLVPSVLLRRLGFEVGGSAEVRGACGQLRLELMPHAGHMRGLAGELKSLGINAGTRISVGIDKDGANLQYVGSTLHQKGTTEDLLIKVGIPPDEATGNIWAIVGSALGFSEARDRLAIADILRKRERPDLARLAIDSRDSRVEKAPSGGWLNTDCMVEDPALFGFKDANDVLHIAAGLSDGVGANIPLGVEKGPLGLLWQRIRPSSVTSNQSSSSTLDKEWVRWARAFASALGAAHSRHIRLTTDGVGWTVGNLKYNELIDALEAITLNTTATGPIPAGGEEFFLPSAFAFRRLSRDALQAGLRELNFTSDGIVGVTADGRCSSPCSPRDVILFCLN